MDLLDKLLRYEHEGARQELRDALDSGAHSPQALNFNAFDVEVERDSNDTLLGSSTTLSIGPEARSDGRHV